MKSEKFDVLIVYNQSRASSASTKSKHLNTPFKDHPSYDAAYGYFLKTCADLNLTAALSTSADIIGSGRVKCFWTIKDNVWEKHLSSANSCHIFDKFSPTGFKGKKLRKLLFSSSKIHPFNDVGLFDLFFDKQKTYDELSSFSIPTKTLTAISKESIISECRTLTNLVTNHPHAEDFTSSIILKDRYGAGGIDIFKFGAHDFDSILDTIRANPEITFIIQPFIKFNLSFKHLDVKSSADLRLIYLNGKIISSYIRTSKAGDFRCNQHQGGSLIYLKPSELPPKVLLQAKLVIKKFKAHNSLFTLDFVSSNAGNPYLLEGNTGPGLNWDRLDQTDMLESKKLIRAIVKELSRRIKSKPATRKYLHPKKSIGDHDTFFPTTI